MGRTKMYDVFKNEQTVIVYRMDIKNDIKFYSSVNIL